MIFVIKIFQDMILVLKVIIELLVFHATALVMHVFVVWNFARLECFHLPVAVKTESFASVVD